MEAQCRASARVHRCRGNDWRSTGIARGARILRRPAGARQLADAIVRVELVEITQLPLYIVPGVRQQAADSTDEGICTGDVMRGEESLIVGLVASGRMRARECLLNLGSHWKWIVLDGECQIASSRTSLTGEMIHAVQTHTLLASGLSPERPEVFDMHWLHEGMRQSQREGLFRALLCVRPAGVERTNEQRAAHLIPLWSFYSAGDLCDADVRVLL